MLLFDNKCVFKSSTGHGLKLKRCLGTGAQGKVYATEDLLLVAKIPNNKRTEAFDKLYFMMDFQPELDEKNRKDYQTELTN